MLPYINQRIATPLVEPPERQQESGYNYAVQERVRFSAANNALQETFCQSFTVASCLLAPDPNPNPGFPVAGYS